MNYNELKMKGSKWITIDNVWHNVDNNDKILCSGNYSTFTSIDIDNVEDKSNICAECFHKLKLISIDEVVFNTRLFSNDRVLKIMEILEKDDKRHHEFLYLLEGQKKLHLDYEFKKMIYNGLIYKYGYYYSLTERGELACKIGKVITAYREKDNERIKEVIEEIRRLI